MRAIMAVFGIGLLASACGQPAGVSDTKSLTDADYKGKKYYLGWGVNGNGNGSMDNEVKYDVLHTHDIFTKNVGGDYIGTKLIGEQQATGANVRRQWSELTSKMTADDMYMQYSSGHGYQGGLALGLDYDDIIDATLGMPTKEKIVFTMACYSGGLVDRFDELRDRWDDYATTGKTLFVMASSKADEESSTGPGTDSDQPNGPNGSAGSAYGHALWKALIGYADLTRNGGNGNGTIELGEVIDYVVEDTQNEGGHTPVYTGVYDRKLAISRKPTFAEAVRLLGAEESGKGTTSVDDLIRDGIVTDRR